MQLLEHFKDLTLHPKNAEELKGLILQMAIQGKLTAQWRNDNPDVSVASDLLDRIRSYNAEQLKLNKRRVSISKGGIEEILDIPVTWVQVKNYDLFNLQKGKNPKDLSETKKKFVYQDIAALDRGNIRRYSDDEKAPKCKDTDILVVCDGSRSGLVLDGKFGVVGSTLAIIHTPPFIKEYIKLIFLQDFERANANMVGAAIPHLDTKGLLLTTIGLPPLEEQKAIVATVNQLFAEVEQLEDLTKQRIQLKEDFVTSALRQLSTEDTSSPWAFLQPHFKTFFTEKSSVKKLRESILQLAVQGKLTKLWREQRTLSGAEVEDASVLLERIKAEKEALIKAKIIKKEKPLPAITEDEIPYDLPEGWVWCRFGDVIRDIEAGKSPRCYPEAAPLDSWGVIKMSAISWGKFNGDENKTLPNENDAILKNEIKPGDFILTRANTSELIAKSVVVPNDVREKLLLNDKTLRFTFPKEVDVQFTNLFNNGSQARRHYVKVSTGTSDSMQNISRENIKRLAYPFPPLEEQKAIVQKVNALMALCDTLEKEIETHQTTQEHWMQSCLKEVFEEPVVAEESNTNEASTNLSMAAEGSAEYKKKGRK